MDSVLDRPVTSRESQELSPSVLVRAVTACHSMNYLSSRGGAVELRHVTFQSEDDLGMGKVDVSSEVVTQPDPTRLDPPVPLVVGRRLREKKTPNPPP